MKIRGWKYKSLSVVYVLAFFCASIGLGAVFGYIFDSQPMYQWTKQGIGMALNTAIVITLFGWALMQAVETIDNRL